MSKTKTIFFLIVPPIFGLLIGIIASAIFCYICDISLDSISLRESVAISIFPLLFLFYGLKESISYWFAINTKIPTKLSEWKNHKK